MLLYLLITSHLLLSATAQIADNMLPFIDAPQGIAFKADNLNYLARVYDDGTSYVLADRATKDPYTKYHVHQVDGDLLAFECDGEGSGYFMQVSTTNNTQTKTPRNKNK